MTLLKDLFGGFDLLPSWGVPEPWDDWDLLRTATAKPPTVVSELTFNDEDCSSDMIYWPTIQSLPNPSFFSAGTNAQLAQALSGTGLTNKAPRRSKQPDRSSFDATSLFLVNWIRMVMHESHQTIHQPRC